MKKKILKVAALAFCSLFISTSCGGNEVNYGDWENINNFELEETDIGTNITPNAEKLSKYTEENPLKVALVTDSGTLNDHSFNESAWKGVNDWATKNGGGTVGSNNTVDTGKIRTFYYQPAENEYTTQGRLAAMKEAVTKFGAKVLVLPGYLFQGAIKAALEDPAFKDVNILALDCLKEDDNYQPYEYTDKVTSVIYREEQAGFLAGYASVMDNYTKLGFVGGMAVPAVVRYGSGYVQGAAYAAEQLKLEEPVSVQYYYAGEFAATAEATSYANSWYSNGNAEIIFACGGAVYQSVLSASESNNNAPWIGVDVNQHADTSINSRDSIVTSAMKNLTNAVEVLLTSYVDNDETWPSNLQGEVVTVGAKSKSCKLPTPSEDGDAGCWGFKTFTEDQYHTIYNQIESGSVKVNSNSDNEELKDNNFGVNPEYCVVNYIG